ncbi:MAG: MCE family protein, partial [Bacteroidales bacterium]|nr:MCE family protein [Bacteroidales bacterium]
FVINMAFKIQRNTKIGIFVIIAAAALIWGINFLKGINFFSSDQVFFARYERIDGLDASCPVELNGLIIGKVRSINMQKDYSMVVEIHINNDVKIPRNSIAKIVSKGIMGNMAIKMDISGNSEYHNSGDTLLSSLEMSLTEQVSQEVAPVKKKAEELLADIDTLIISIQTVMSERTTQNLKKSIESIRTTISYLEGTAFSLDTLMRGQKYKISRTLTNIEMFSDNLRSNTGKLTNIINNFSNLSDTLSKARIAETISNADKALAQANDIFEKINRGEGTVGMLVNNDSLYRNLEEASKNLDRLLDDIRINPKRYVSFPLFDFSRQVYKDKKDKKQ